MKPVEELSNVELRRRRFMALGIFVALIGLIVSFDRVTLRPSRDAATCQSNLKQLGLAMFQYTRDYDETYPLAKNWSVALRPYHKGAPSTVHCPARDDLPFGYAMHASVAGLSLVDIDDSRNMVLYFDSDAGTPNRTDKGSSLPPTPRHSKGHSIAFNDGHVEFVKVPDMKYGYDPAQMAQSRKDFSLQQDFSPQAQQERSTLGHQRERQSLLQKQRMKRVLTPAEQQFLKDGKWPR